MQKPCSKVDALLKTLDRTITLMIIRRRNCEQGRWTNLIRNWLDKDELIWRRDGADTLSEVALIIHA